MSSFSWSSWVLIRRSSRTPQIQWTIPLLADVKRRIVSLDTGHVSQPYSKLFLIQELKILPQFFSKILRSVMIGNSFLKLFHAVVMRPSCIYTTTRFSNHVTKVLKSWHSFECVFTGMHLREIQYASWGTFTFTIFASKHAFFLQCPFNSWASFMNPEDVGLAKYWVYTNSFGTHTAGPFNISCCFLSLAWRTKYLSLAHIYS